MKAISTLALAALSCAAVAAPVYKCKNEKGQTVFTDKKCDFDAHQERVWDSNLGGSQYPATFSGATPSEMVVAGSAQQGQGEQTEVDAPVQSRQDPQGYICSTEAKTWVQNYPCPASVREPRTMRFTHSDGTWTDIQTQSPTGVDQRGLSHAALCAELARPSRDNESSYERKKLKHDSGCP